MNSTHPDTSPLGLKLKNGQRLDHAKRNVLIAKLYEALSDGYMTTYALSKMLQVSRPTIERFRPLVDEMIAKQRPDRNTIRNLEIQRAYKIVEMLMDDLKECKGIEEKVKVYNQIAKHSSRLALITGLNIETQVNVDQHQLVIIRADNHRKPKIEEQAIQELPSETPPQATTDGHTIPIRHNVIEDIRDKG